MHKEILTKKQNELLPLLKLFADQFGLVGGTAMALHVGHRQSVDFDLCASKKFDNFIIGQKVKKNCAIQKIFIDTQEEYTIVVNGVKVTFFYYPFVIDWADSFGGLIKLPDLLTLSAMKAYVLGRRAKWKDYVDLFFTMKNRHGISEIIKKAKQIFKNEFNEKIFRSQLCYFNDIDYSESVIYMPGQEVEDRKIKQGLINFSLDGALDKI